MPKKQSKKQKRLTKVGLNVVRLRKEAGFTQEFLAKNSMINLATLQKIENMQSEDPRVLTCWKIALGLGVKVDDLLK